MGGGLKQLVYMTTAIWRPEEIKSDEPHSTKSVKTLSAVTPYIL